MSNLWIFTPEGFFSSRKDEYCKDDEVMVRSRVYEDLLALADMLGMTDPQIIRLPRSDYLYRMPVQQNDWNIYCAHAAMNHDPETGIKDTEDMDRYLAYLRIWEIMQGLQKLKDAEKRGNKKQIDRFREEFDDMVYPEILYKKPKSTYKHGMWLEGMNPHKKKKKKKKKKKNYRERRKAKFVTADDMAEFDTSALYNGLKQEENL